MWASKAATLQDFRAIKPELAERLAEEATLAKEMYGSDVPGLLKDAIRGGRALTLTHGASAQAIIAWELTDPVSLTTGFWARESFFKPSAYCVRFCRRLIHDIQREQGLKVIKSYSLGKDPKLGRWYGALGFKEVDEGNPHRTFELLP